VTIFTARAESAPPVRRGRWAVALGIALCIAGITLLVWALFHGQVAAPDHAGPIAGFSYSGADRWESPIEGERPSATDLDRDLALLSRHTQRIRTYTAAAHPE